MKGWQIFTHSVRLVFSNLENALRVSLVLYLVQAANQVFLFLIPPQMTEVGDISIPMLAPDLAAQSLVLLLLSLIASLWIAVAWHRFVLAQEYPSGWLPRWHGPFMMSYLVRSILLAVAITLGVVAASLPIGFFILALPGFAGLMSLLPIGFAAYLFFRLSVILPAAALGRKMTLGEAWAASKGEGAALLTLTAIVVAASVIIQLPSMLNNNPASIINLIYGLVVNWFATIIGISVLTTLYGHFVEKRPID